MGKREEYIKECKNFKWLQENVRVQCRHCEYKYYYPDYDPDTKLPRLDTLIELMGRAFHELQRIGDTWYCLYLTEESEIATETGKTPQLACLAALKKIKGE